MDITSYISYYLESMMVSKAMKELAEHIRNLIMINKLDTVEKPYRLKLLESDIPSQLKATALKKVTNLRYMEPGSGEYYKVKNIYFMTERELDEICL